MNDEQSPDHKANKLTREYLVNFFDYWKKIVQKYVPHEKSYYYYRTAEKETEEMEKIEKGGTNKTSNRKPLGGGRGIGRKKRKKLLYKLFFQQTKSLN